MSSLNPDWASSEDYFLVFGVAPATKSEVYARQTAQQIGDRFGDYDLIRAGLTSTVRTLTC